MNYNNDPENPEDLYSTDEDFKDANDSLDRSDDKETVSSQNSENDDPKKERKEKSERFSRGRGRSAYRRSKSSSNRGRGGYPRRLNSTENLSNRSDNSDPPTGENPPIWNNPFIVDVDLNLISHDQLGMVELALKKFGMEKHVFLYQPRVDSDAKKATFCVNKKAASALLDENNCLKLFDTPCPFQISKGQFLVILNLAQQFPDESTTRSILKTLPQLQDQFITIEKLYHVHYRLLFRNSDALEQLKSQKQISIFEKSFPVVEPETVPKPPEARDSSRREKSSIESPSSMESCSPSSGPSKKIILKNLEKEFLKSKRSPQIRQFEKQEEVRISGFEDHTNSIRISASTHDSIDIAEKFIKALLSTLTERQIPDISEPVHKDARSVIKKFDAVFEFNEHGRQLTLLGSKDTINILISKLTNHRMVFKLDQVSQNRHSEIILMIQRWVSSKFGNKVKIFKKPEFDNFVVLAPKHFNMEIISREVNQMIKEYIESIDSIELPVNGQSLERPVMKHIRTMVQELERQFHEVKVTVHESRGKIQIQGVQENAARCADYLQRTILSKIQSIQISPQTVPQPLISDYNKNVSKRLETLRQEADQHGIKVLFQNPPSKVFVISKSDVDFNQELLNKLEQLSWPSVGTVQVPHEFPAAQARERSRDLSNSFNVVTHFDSRERIVTIVGDLENVQNAQQDFTRKIPFRLAFNPKTKLLDLLMRTRAKNIQLEEQRLNVEVRDNKQGFIHSFEMTGNREACQSMFKFLEDLQQEIESTIVWKSLNVDLACIPLLDNLSQFSQIRTKNHPEIKIHESGIPQPIARLSHLSSGSIIEIHKGDITNANVQVIVNAANENLQHAGGVATAIADKAGPELERQSEFYHDNPIKVGEAVVTSGGNLFAPFVIHAVGPRFVNGYQGEGQTLVCTIVAVLNKAHSLKADSIAFPLISSGIFGFPEDLAIKSLLSGIEQFLRNKTPGTTPPLRIEVWEVDQGKCDALNRCLHQFYSTNSQSFGDFKSTVPIKIVQQSSQPQQQKWYWRDDDGQWAEYSEKESQAINQKCVGNNTRFQLTMHSGSYEIDVVQKTQTNMQTGHMRLIANEIPMRVMAQWYWKDAHDFTSYGHETNQLIESHFVQRASFVQFSVTRHNDDKPGNYRIDFKSMEQINLRTNFKRVVKRTEILCQESIIPSLNSDDEDLIDENNQEEEIHASPTKSRILVGGTPQEVDSTITEIQRLISSLYQADEMEETYSVPVPDLKKIEQLHHVRIQRKQDGDGSVLEINGLQLDVNNAKREIRQRISEQKSRNPKSNKLPLGWLTFSNSDQAPELSPVPQGTQDFQLCERRLKETIPNIMIAKIERVQNMGQWNLFSMARAELSKSRRGNPNEKWLFHGTRGTHPKEIWGSRKGFDFRFSANGMWGQGAYFAVNASYSNGYRFTAPDGYFQMFLAQVLVGDAIRIPSDNTLRLPPPKPGTADRYDTVEGETGGSIVYIKYEHYQMYPTFLITFKA